MKFIITRTSVKDTDNDKPCEEAVAEEIYNDVWEKMELTWLIEIETLDELVALHEKHGNIIMRPCLSNDEYKIIEIYDDWRE